MIADHIHYCIPEKNVQHKDEKYSDFKIGSTLVSIGHVETNGCRVILPEPLSLRISSIATGQDEGKGED